MKLSIDTDLEEIAELKHAIAIIEDALKRRENPDEETQQQELTQETPIEQPAQEATPEPMSEPQPEVPTEQPKTEAPPEVDLSQLATSDYGERVENRSMTEEPTNEEPQQDNKVVMKEIIQSLKDRKTGSPIQMQDIINLAKDKSIGEEETRNLVNDLQKNNAI